MIYESTRDINRKLNPSEAILQGLSEEGGLFVLRDLGKNKLDLENLIGKSYYEIAEAVLRLFVDFSLQRKILSREHHSSSGIKRWTYP